MFYVLAFAFFFSVLIHLYTFIHLYSFKTNKMLSSVSKHHKHAFWYTISLITICSFVYCLSSLVKHIAATALSVMVILHCCWQRIFNQQTIIFRCV